MEHTDFVHLHNHTQYSLLDGALRLSNLMKRAHELKMPAISITDHGNMFGVIEFYDIASRHGIKPIIGCEVYVAPESRFDRSSLHGISDASYHLVLLAKDLTGYKNLLELVSAGYLQGFYYRPRIDKELLMRHKDGLIGLSACLKGEVSSLLLKGEKQKAKDIAKEFEDILGKGNFYLELMDHGIEEQIKVNSEIIKISKELDIPLVATNDCHYLNREDSKAHEVLLCIQTGKTLEDKTHMKFSTEEFYFKTPQEMKTLFAEVPSAIKNTIVIAQHCNLELKFDTFYLPKYDLPSEHTDIDEYLEKLCRDGLKKHFPQNTSQEVENRLKHELEVVKNAGFSGYFLIVWDFINFAKKSNIMVGPGRGSAAGSIISYLLEITEINPLKYGLFFERFLNPDRIQPPDIDIDFSDRRRAEVLDYVTQKYGRENVAQIITFGKLQARLAVRDVGRVIGMPYAEVGKIAKLIPADPKITIEKALKSSPEFAEIAKEEKVKNLLLIAQSLEGLLRHASTHASGVVIARENLLNYVPLYKDTGESEISTQYDMQCLSRIGLLKMDFLGLRTLTTIEETIKIVKDRHNKVITLSNIPLDDLNTFKLFCNAQTLGVFQLESPGMRDLLRKFKPQNIHDIMAVVALFRPGPMKIIDDYVKRRHGVIPVKYDHPLLKDILEETYGTIVYQEQVMQIAVTLGGFTMGQADLLRSAMSKKKMLILEKQRDLFVAGAKKKKISQETAEHIYDMMAEFGEYGFNKSHSAAYSLVTYQTAYLKANYTIEFMAALLTSETGNPEKVSSYIAECKKMGITVLPPDINESFANFTVLDNSKIRFGLAAIKNVGLLAIESIVHARSEKRFTSLLDFCERIDTRLVNKRVVESFIKSGCFDSFGLKRSQLIKIADEVLEIAQLSQQDKANRQISLLDGTNQTAKKISIPDLEEYPENRILAFEKELLGVYVSGHPLAVYELEMKRYTNTSSLTIKDFNNGKTACIGGIVENIVRKISKRGETWAIVTIEDLEGSIEVLVFSKLYEKFVSILRKEAIFFVKGKVDSERDQPRMIADDFIPIEEAKEKLATSLHIKLMTLGLEEFTLVDIKKTLEQFPGRCSVFLHFMESPDKEISTMEIPIKVAPLDELISQIEKSLGENSIWLSS